jgi:hypothetical protein
MEVKIVAGAKPYPRTNMEGSVSNAVAPKRQTLRQELRHRLHVTNNKRTRVRMHDSRVVSANQYKGGLLAY